MSDQSKMKQTVQLGYNKGQYAETFRENHRLSDTEMFMMNKFILLLDQGKSVVDLGCGTGIPYDKILVNHGLKVTGVDFSIKHINAARDNVAAADYIQEDMFKFVEKQPDKNVDAYMALYSIFHLPKDEQEVFLQNTYRPLKDGGLLLGTFGTQLTQDLKKDFCGAEMIWEGYSTKEYEFMLNAMGFSIIENRYQSHKNDKENHYWMMLRK